MEKWTGNGQESKLQQINAELAGMTQGLFIDADANSVAIDLVIDRLRTIQSTLIGLSYGMRSAKFCGTPEKADVYNQILALLVNCTNAIRIIRKQKKEREQ